MSLLPLHEFHELQDAQFTEVNGIEFVASYGDVAAEYRAFKETAGFIDLSGRSRVCLLGADRLKFLHGQVTNDVQGLKADGGCYAALVNAKAKMETDLYIYRLADEILLDFEPALTEKVTARLDKYIIADDVQIVDVAPHYGLVSVQGPKSAAAIEALGIVPTLPAKSLHWVKDNVPDVGDIYVMNQPRFGTTGYDVFIPSAGLGMIADKLLAAVKAQGGRACGWEAFEAVRIEAGIPRFGADMDETNLPPEAGIEPRAVSYNKGCYIGQEVIARIRTYGQAAKSLRRLELTGVNELPVKGTKLQLAGKDVGYITSAVRLPVSGQVCALGYVRKEHKEAGTVLDLPSGQTKVI
ncbi:MAG TPA: glycine cleavage T C-terminal barrel domain-containing protein [Verrucomicrobiae bacterium]